MSYTCANGVNHALKSTAVVASGRCGSHCGMAATVASVDVLWMSAQNRVPMKEVRLMGRKNIKPGSHGVPA